MSIVRLFGILLALGLAAGCQTTPPTGYDSAAETLFNAPHRIPDSMSEMPKVEPVERAFTAALAAAVAGDLPKARREADAAGYLVLERKQDGRDGRVERSGERSGRAHGDEHLHPLPLQPEGSADRRSDAAPDLYARSLTS